MPTFNIHDAKTHLSRLVERAASGEEITIARAGKPICRLMPLGRAPTARPLGLARGEFHVPADFDAPLPDALIALFEQR